MLFVLKNKALLTQTRFYLLQDQNFDEVLFLIDRNSTLLVITKSDFLGIIVHFKK